MQQHCFNKRSEEFIWICFEFVKTIWFKHIFQIGKWLLWYVVLDLLLNFQGSFNDTELSEESIALHFENCTLELYPPLNFAPQHMTRNISETK